MAANRKLRTKYSVEWQHEDDGNWYRVGGKWQFRTNASACKALALLALHGVDCPLRITKKRCKSRAPKDQIFIKD